MNAASLRATLEAVLSRHSIPAGGVAISRANEPLLVAVAGTRSVDSPEPVIEDAPWHIGSCAKAIAATVLLRLSESGHLDTHAPISRLLGDDFEEGDPGYGEATLCHLLSHTAGLPPFTSEHELTALAPLVDERASPREQRARLSRHYLARPPVSPVGRVSYSNLGYVIAGHLAEHCLGMDWEKILEREVFQPLGITQAGWGPPRGGIGLPDPPMGHRRTAGSYASIPPDSPLGDNSALWAPAGTLHLPLREWMRYCRDQLKGRAGQGLLLTTAGYRKQHTPVSDIYALGWGVQTGPDAQPTQITHTGSNGLWLADVRMFPERDQILLCTLSAGDDVAEDALRDLLRYLLKECLN